MKPSNSRQAKRDSMDKQEAIIENKRIPWYKMPLSLRALPLAKRPAALAEYEHKCGHYDWRTGFIWVDGMPNEEDM